MNEDEIDELVNKQAKLAKRLSEAGGSLGNIHIADNHDGDQQQSLDEASKTDQEFNKSAS